MKSASLSLMLAAALPGLACNQTTDHSHAAAPSAEAAAPAAAPLARAAVGPAPAASAPAAAAPATALRLDGAKRWKADEHTKQAVAALKARLADPALHGQALGDALDKEVQALVRGCTMDGEAHNQLHHWLLPLIDQIKGVQQGKEGAAEQVRASVAAFEAHFE